jgi:hypothetical protein
VDIDFDFDFVSVGSVNILLADRRRFVGPNAAVEENNRVTAGPYKDSSCRIMSIMEDMNKASTKETWRDTGRVGNQPRLSG